MNNDASEKKLDQPKSEQNSDQPILAVKKTEYLFRYAPTGLTIVGVRAYPMTGAKLTLSPKTAVQHTYLGPALFATARPQRLVHRGRLEEKTAVRRVSVALVEPKKCRTLPLLHGKHS